MVGDEYEDTQPEQVMCEMLNGTFILGVTCKDCDCFLKYQGICHRCPENYEYHDEDELREHMEFVWQLVAVYALPQ